MNKNPQNDGYVCYIKADVSLQIFLASNVIFIQGKPEAICEKQKEKQLFVAEEHDKLGLLII